MTADPALRNPRPINGRVVARTIAALLLLTPLVAMQWTDEVAWTVGDFAVFGVMLVVALGGYEWVTRTAGDAVYRIATGLAIATAFLLVWIQGAVGIIGNGADGANLLFGGVLAVGLVGAVIARLRPRGMARTLVAMALVQVTIGVAATLAAWGDIGWITALFAASWLASGWLFRRAARRQDVSCVER